jgi:hypothetical protein
VVCKNAKGVEALVHTFVVEAKAMSATFVVTITTTTICESIGETN